MRKFKANSSVIDTVFFENNNLIIKFNGGTYYKYKGVSESIFEAFGNAESSGLFFNKYIKHNFPYEKIDFVEPTEEKKENTTEDLMEILANIFGGTNANIGNIANLNKVISNVNESSKTVNIPYINGKVKRIIVVEFE